MREPDERAIYHTERLRRDVEDWAYVMLRRHLTELSLDVNRSVLAEFFGEDVKLLLGFLIIAPERRVIEFEIDYMKQPKISEWRDITESWRKHAFWDAIEAGFRLYEGGAGQP